MEQRRTHVTATVRTLTLGLLLAGCTSPDKEATSAAPTPRLPALSPGVESIYEGCSPEGTGMLRLAPETNTAAVCDAAQQIREQILTDGHKIRMVPRGLTLNQSTSLLYPIVHFADEQTYVAAAQVNSQGEVFVIAAEPPEPMPGGTLVWEGPVSADPENGLLCVQSPEGAMHAVGQLTVGGQTEITLCEGISVVQAQARSHSA